MISVPASFLLLGHACFVTRLNPVRFICSFLVDSGFTASFKMGESRNAMITISESTTRYMGAEDWAVHRDQITRLYRDENRTLKETMDIVEEEHGLKATSVPTPCLFSVLIVTQQDQDVQEQDHRVAS